MGPKCYPPLMASLRNAHKHPTDLADVVDLEVNQGKASQRKESLKNPNLNESVSMKGIIPWFTRNGVAANLLMVSIVLAVCRTWFQKSS